MVQDPDQALLIDGMTASATVELEVEPEHTWWLYLLACRDGRTYVGIAIDVETRFRAHVAGKGAKFTRANPPIGILGAQSFSNRSAASKAEYALKQRDKLGKLAWAQQHPLSR